MTRWHLSPRFSNGSSLAPQRPIICKQNRNLVHESNTIISGGFSSIQKLCAVSSGWGDQCLLKSHTK